jgi:hypothetical protein
VRAETCVYFALHLTYEQTNQKSNVIAIARLYYNATTPPAGLFDDFLNIQSTDKNIGSRSYLDLVTTMGTLKPIASIDRLVTDLVSKSNDNSELKLT